MNSWASFILEQILSKVSTAASNASVYVLVNAVEKESCDSTEHCSDGFKLFNSNFVFDRRGCVISRYRKFTLYWESLMNSTKEVEVSTFESDFDVTFGHNICIDLMFESPTMDIIRKGVKHFLYPSMWFSETPFLTSIQVQQSFAQSNNIVFLSAGKNSPSHSNTGSGIFVGKHGAVEKLISCRNESRLMIAKVPKDVDNPSYEPVESEVETCSPAEMDVLKLWRFTPTSTHPLQQHLIATNNGVTCEFVLNFTKPQVESKVGFRLAAFSGTRSYSGLVSAGEIHCAIIACTDKNNEATCGDKLEETASSAIFNSISIKMTIENYELGNYLVMPTTLDTSVLPLKTKYYDFEAAKVGGVQKFHMKSLAEVKNVLTFGIYGRNYALDEVIGRSNSSLMTILET
jgi:hypothetical protein